MTGDDAWQGLSFATCQAHNTIPVAEAVADYLGRRLSLPIGYLDSADWRESFEGITTGRIAIGWICGRPYADLAGGAPFELLAAPVMSGARYGDRPVYFSDVIVRRDSPYRSFDDLRGVTWAYNEPGSQSGYHIMRYHLATLGETTVFFGRAVESGAHLESLRLVLAGEADTAAIDSTVLEWEMEERPELAESLRVIEALGPSPIPPLVISTAVPPQTRESVRSELLDMHLNEDGRLALQTGRLARFAAVTDSDYDLIRDMGALVERVEAERRARSG